MTFPKFKAVIASSGLACGLAAALMWHWYQGAILNRGYPFDTFLFLSHIRFTDFYDTVSGSSNWSPYSQLAVYLPFTYVVLHPFSWMPAFPGYLLYLAITLVLLFRSIFLILATSLGHTRFAALTAAALLCCSSPFIVSIDRGNIELTVMWLICECVYRMHRGSYAGALAYLVPAICMKVYPAVLLAMLLPRRRWTLLGISLVTATAITIASLSLFTGSLADNFQQWRRQASQFTTNYVIGNAGMGGTASVWNAVKIVAIQQQLYDLNHDASHAVNDFNAYLGRLLRWYTIGLAITSLYLAFHVVVVETSLWRRVSLLNLFLVLATPAGAEYKLVHAITSLVCLIVTKEQRAGDRAAVALITLALIPKKYFYFPLIVTDSGVADCSLAVLVNPMLLCGAAIVLGAGAWSHTTAGKRRARLAAFLRGLACGNRKRPAIVAMG
jgi:hypothetical protein